MSRTKARARSDLEDHALREVAKQKREDGKKNGAGKRKRGPESSLNQAKRNRTSPGDAPTGLDERMSSLGERGNADQSNENEDVAPATSISTSSSSAPPIFGGLEAICDITTMSIISSSNINKKVTRALSLLSVYPVSKGEKQKVVVMYAKAPVVAKMISVAEIVKREVAKVKIEGGTGGKWFQYNVVGEYLEERERRAEDVEKVEDGAEEGFETMKTPFERAIEGKKMIKAVPVMSLYLSRGRIVGLRKAYGEQTNTQDIKD